MIAMTLRDMITNPSGPYSRQISARYAIRDSLDAAFKAAMMDPIRRKRFKIAGVEGKDSTFTVWIKVPSSKYDVDYDVVLQLNFLEGVRATISSEAKLYCNSPSWVFSLGYTATTSGLLIPAWKSALGRAATEPSTVTNPHSDYGFDRIVYHAISFLVGPGGCLTKNDLVTAVTTIRNKVPNPKDSVYSAEHKLFEYGRAKEKFATAARLLKKAEKGAKELDEKRAKADKRGEKNSRVAKTGKAAKAVGHAKTARKANSRTAR